MRIALLSRKATNRSSRRLVEAFESRGHEVLAVDPLDCVAAVGTAGAPVWWKGSPLAADAVVPRYGPGLMEFASPILRQLESCGFPSLNSADSIERSRDKFQTLQILAREGLPVPETVMARSPEQLARALALVGGGPVVVKVLKGSQGTGVLRLDSAARAERFLRILYEEKQSPLVQRCVLEANGRDERVLVVGDRVVAGMAREAREGDFRANLHRGGRIRALRVESAIGDLAVRAARSLGLDVAGVDLLRSRGGPVILELNPSPGLEGIERTTGIDVAGAMAERCFEKAARHRT